MNGLCVVAPAAVIAAVVLAVRAHRRRATALEALVWEPAVAVTPFRNGRGVVRVVRDGRLIQLAARLAQPAEVGVGARLRVVDVEVEKQRLVVLTEEQSWIHR